MIKKLFKVGLILLLFSFISYTTILKAATTVPKIPVTFVNGIDGSVLGIAKFITNEKGKDIDSKVMNIRWDEKQKVLNLEPGCYGVTQRMPPFRHPIFGTLRGKFVNFERFCVKDTPLVIPFY